MSSTARENISHALLDPSSQATNPIRNREDLMSAFEVFNSVSAQLAETYSEMEQRVGSLNQELHQVAEQRLQELREKERLSSRLENLLKLLPAGVVVLDRQGRVTDCNPAALELLGEPLLGAVWRDVIRRCFAPQLDDGHEISMRDGRRINMVTRSLDGEPGQLILLTDLTETRQLQQRLDRHRRLSEIGRMMSSLAHQIRTPLSAAMLYTGHLCESELSDVQRQRFSEKVLSRLNHLDQQVKDMLIFVKGDVKLTDTISLQELFAELEAAMEATISSSGAVYQLHNEAATSRIHCNRESMVGALMNLVNNAIQSKPNGVSLVISGRLIEDGQLQISIADNGPGMDEALLKNLQEPFYTTKSQGTGLGLMVVRSVLQAHQGRFELRSKPGAGVTALITLPLMTETVVSSPISEEQSDVEH
jgi:two-component system sensor histidine kinase FlrB